MIHCKIIYIHKIIIMIIYTHTYNEAVASNSEQMEEQGEFHDYN